MKVFVGTREPVHTKEHLDYVTDSGMTKPVAESYGLHAVSCSEEPEGYCQSFTR